MKIRNIIVSVVIIVLMALAGIIAAASPLKPTDDSYVNAPTIAPVMQPSVTAPPTVAAGPASSTAPTVMPSVTALPSPTVSLGPKQAASSEWVWPCPSCKDVTELFGMRYHPIKHEYVFCDHISIAAHDGDPVVSAITGEVAYVGTDNTKGNYIVVSNKEGTSTTYQHLKTPYVTTGAAVKAGDTIGTVGSTGDVTGSTMVFSVYVNGDAVDPMSFYKDIA